MREKILKEMMDQLIKRLGLEDIQVIEFCILVEKYQTTKYEYLYSQILIIYEEIA